MIGYKMRRLLAQLTTLTTMGVRAAAAGIKRRLRDLRSAKTGTTGSASATGASVADDGTASPAPLQTAAADVAQRLAASAGAIATADSLEPALRQLLTSALLAVQQLKAAHKQSPAAVHCPVPVWGKPGKDTTPATAAAAVLRAFGFGAMADALAAELAGGGEGAAGSAAGGAAGSGAIVVAAAAAGAASGSISSPAERKEVKKEKEKGKDKGKGKGKDKGSDKGGGSSGDAKGPKPPKPPKLDPLDVGVSPEVFQLGTMGHLLERRPPGQRDSRVDGFIPDKWQRRLLDVVDAGRLTKSCFCAVSLHCKHGYLHRICYLAWGGWEDTLSAPSP